MSQAYEDSIQLFCVRCEDVGLYCNCTICGISEERVIDNTIMHMIEYHAIEPDGMTTRMRMKIEENPCVHHSPLPRSPSSFNSHF